MNPAIDTKVLMYLVWGVGTVVVYGIVLRRDYVAFRLQRSDTSWRTVFRSFALFLTALCSFLAITAVFWSPVGQGIRGFLVATALGAFFAAGIVMATDRRNTTKTERT